MKTCQPNGTWERREGMEWTNYQPCLNFAVSSDYFSSKYEASTDFATKYVQQNKIKVFLMLCVWSSSVTSTEHIFLLILIILSVLVLIILPPSVFFLCQ